jgi:Bax protein
MTQAKSKPKTQSKTQSKTKSKPGNTASTAGTMFHKVALGVVVAGAAGMFAIGIATFDGAPAPQGDTRQAAAGAVSSDGRTVVRFAVDPADPVRAAAKIGKPAKITLANSTGKLWELFREIGYEIDGVRTHGEVPRLFLASLPEDLRKLRVVSKRKITFIKSTLPLILHVNELILQDRKRLKSIFALTENGTNLTPLDKIWLEEISELYGADGADPIVLLKRVDIIPPSLAIAQAAEESGWGTSRFAREGNALFGQRAYKASKKGIVPHEREDGKAFKVRAFDHLIDGVKAYAHNLNSHFAYKDFRAARAEMRANSGQVEGYRLAGALMRYSERGADYISTIRLIMRANTLKVFDGARLGNKIDPGA